MRYIVGNCDYCSLEDECSNELELLLYLNRNGCSTNIGIHAHLMMANTTTLAKAEHLVKMVKQRGQFPATYRHGICVVGTPTHATSAHCKDVNNAPAQENATPSTCNKCPFHYHNEAYLRNLETDLAEMSFKLGGESLMALERKQLQISIIDLKAVIADHKLRLKIGHS